MQKHGMKAELADLVRARTELECVVEDLKVAGERGEERRSVIVLGYLQKMMIAVFGR